jgi:hypothetical protein
LGDPESDSSKKLARESGTTPTLISLIPFLWGRKGHMYGYHLSVGRSARLLGWKHRAAIATADTFSNLPEDWEACLDTDSLEAPGIRKILVLPLFFGVYRFARSISRYLNNLDSTDKSTKILFLERVNPYQLLAVTLSLSLVRRENILMWLLYRHRPDANKRHKHIYRFLTRAISKRLGKQFQLLTDSELLKVSLSRFLGLPVTVMPVPHTLANSPDPRPNRHPEIICWWAGPPREAKGWQIIRNLLALTSPGAQGIRLVAAKSSNLTPRSDGMKLELIDDTLSPTEYARWLFTADIILLPYDAYLYREETSGIFIEAVVAGKFPFVSDDTWMAFELRKHGLHELIVDWESPDLLTFISELQSRVELRHKLDVMRDAYSKYHNENAYAKSMMELYIGIPTLSPVTIPQ